MMTRLSLLFAAQPFVALSRNAPPGLHDETKNGCVADYSPKGCATIRQSLSESHSTPKKSLTTNGLIN